MAKKEFHGSDLELIEQEYGIPKHQIVSFSSNVNPIGISYKLKQSIKTITVIGKTEENASFTFCEIIVLSWYKKCGLLFTFLLLVISYKQV